MLVKGLRIWGNTMLSSGKVGTFTCQFAGDRPYFLLMVITDSNAVCYPSNFVWLAPQTLWRSSRCYKT